jgi:hypothetical protein
MIQLIPGMTYPPLLGSIAYDRFELTKGYLSYKTYIKKILHQTKLE